MKSLIIIFLLSNFACAGVPFRESLLKKWGYKTTHEASGESHQRIRSLKDYGKKLGEPNLKYYARYIVWKESYKSNEEAISQKKEREEALQKDSILSSKSPVLIFQKQNELYFIKSATSIAAWDADHAVIKKKVTGHLKTEEQNKTVQDDTLRSGSSFLNSEF